MDYCMSGEIQSKLRQAQRRLSGNRFLVSALWALTAFLTVAAGLLVVDKLTPLPVDWQTVGGAAFASALFVAFLWTYWTRPTPLDAALELDRRFELQERVSTLISLHEDSPAAAALRADVERRTKEIDVAARMKLEVPRYSWMPIVPLGAFLTLALLVGPFDWSRQADAKETPPEEREKIVEQAKVLEKKVEEKQKLAAEAGLGEEIKELAEQIDKATKDLANNQEVDAKEAVLKLSDLAKKLEERQKELDAVDNMKRSLSKLAETPAGPAAEMAKAMKQGDLETAAKELNKLKEQMEKGALNESERQQLAKQLDQLKEQMGNMANLNERAEQLKKSLPPELLQKELAKLAQDAQQLEQLKELAEKLGECSECLSKGDLSQEAIDSMVAASKELQQMIRDAKERQMLEEMLNDMAECRGGMCEGKEGGLKNQIGAKASSQGKGIGQSGGPSEQQQARDDEETRQRKLRVQGKPRQGPVSVVGTAPGGSFRGESKLEIADAVRSASSAAEEAITRQKVPRDYQQHTRDYFERLHGQVKSE